MSPLKFAEVPRDGLGAFLLSVEKMGRANMEWATSISKWGHDSSGGLWASLYPWASSAGLYLFYICV